MGPHVIAENGRQSPTPRQEEKNQVEQQVLNWGSSPGGRWDAKERTWEDAVMETRKPTSSHVPRQRDFSLLSLLNKRLLHTCDRAFHSIDGAYKPLHALAPVCFPSLLLRAHPSTRITYTETLKPTCFSPSLLPYPLPSVLPWCLSSTSFPLSPLPFHLQVPLKKHPLPLFIPCPLNFC